jgi:hypothetical protein
MIIYMYLNALWMAATLLFVYSKSDGAIPISPGGNIVMALLLPVILAPSILAYLAWSWLASARGWRQPQ